MIKNRPYQIYAMGNALVDIEYTIDESMLSKVGLQKSLMTLVDEETQKKMQENLPEPKKRKGGGSAANTAIAFAQLGGNPVFAGKVASDDNGQFYLKDLEKNGVKLHVDFSKIPSGITGKCVVLVTPDAERTMGTFLGMSAQFSEAEINWEYLAQAEYLYIEGYLLCTELGTKAVLKAMNFARKNAIKIALTCSDPGVVQYFRTNFNQVLSEPIDLLFCNKEEALALAETTDLETAKKMIKRKTKNCVITMGAEGAYLDIDGMIHLEPAKVTKVIDANGAGDSFAGGYFYGHFQNWTISQRAKLACTVASAVVSQYGPRLEQEKMQMILKDF